MVPGYTKKRYVEEVTRLWEEVVKEVYLKNPTYEVAGLAEEAWEETKMTPLQYVKFIASPHKVTNTVGRGQKAREYRWKEWLERYE